MKDKPYDVNLSLECRKCINKYFIAWELEGIRTPLIFTLKPDMLENINIAGRREAYYKGRKINFNQNSQPNLKKRDLKAESIQEEEKEGLK